MEQGRRMPGRVKGTGNLNEGGECGRNNAGLAREGVNFREENESARDRFSVCRQAQERSHPLPTLNPRANTLRTTVHQLLQQLLALLSYSASTICCNPSSELAMSSFLNAFHSGHIHWRLSAARPLQARATDKPSYACTYSELQISNFITLTRFPAGRSRSRSQFLRPDVTAHGLMTKSLSMCSAVNTVTFFSIYFGHGCSLPCSNCCQSN